MLNERHVHAGQVSASRYNRLMRGLRTVEDLRLLFTEKPLKEAELLCLINAECLSSEPRRSVLKRLHGHYNRVRGAAEWRHLEQFLS